LKVSERHKHMRHQHTWILGIALLTLCTTAHAYNPIVAEPTEAYEIIPITGDPFTERQYLGSLDGFPDMYELTTTVGFPLKVRVQQRSIDTPIPFSLIVVRQNDDNGGVSEIARFQEEKWLTVEDSTLGITLLESSVFEKEIAPGTYRIEVSTPDNLGTYALVVGDELVTPGYIATLGDIRQLQKHFGYSVGSLLRSPYIFYPLGSILIIIGIILTRRYTKRHA
jgi:hypothetical protein